MPFLRCYLWLNSCIQQDLCILLLCCCAAAGFFAVWFRFAFIMPSDTEMTDVKEKAGGEPRRSERTTKLTEKGRGLRLEFLNGRFKSMVSSINDKVVAVGLLICSEAKSKRIRPKSAQ